MTKPQRATGAARRTVTRNAEIHTPLVSDPGAVGLSWEARRETVASGRILLLPVLLADAARTAPRPARPAAGPGKDRRRAKEDVTAHHGPPVAATAAGRKHLLVAATAAGRKHLLVAATAGGPMHLLVAATAGRRNGRLAVGRERAAVPGFRRLAAR